MAIPPSAMCQEAQRKVVKSDLGGSEQISGAGKEDFSFNHRYLIPATLDQLNKRFIHITGGSTFAPPPLPLQVANTDGDIDHFSRFVRE